MAKLALARASAIASSANVTARPPDAVTSFSAMDVWACGSLYSPEAVTLTDATTHAASINDLMENAIVEKLS